VIGSLLIVRLMQEPIESAEKGGATDAALERWLKPQDWRRYSEPPALSLGEKGRLGDQLTFVAHVIAHGNDLQRPF
jgi:hypothetical protein